MVTSALALGGSEAQLLATAEGLLTLGYHLEIFELNETPPEFGVEAEFWKLGIPCRHTFDFPPELAAAADKRRASELTRFASLVGTIDIVRAGIALKRAIERFRPHAVHCWSDTANIVGGMVATDLDVPRIVLSQRSIPPSLAGDRHAELYREGYGRLLGYSNVAMLSNSEANGASYERWLGLPPRTIAVVRNGLSSRSLAAYSLHEPAKCRARLGLPGSAPVVGTVMRFAAEKDPMLWIETAAAIAPRCPDAWFVLAGYGELADEVRSKVAEHQLAERTIMPGPADAGVVYAAIDVFLLTSRFEGLPNVLIEAQAAGRPVVAPRVGGAVEAFCHRKTGLLVEQRDASSLAAAVVEILADSDWRLAASAYGPAFVADRFAAERMIQEMIEIYRLPMPRPRQAPLDVRDQAFRDAASNRIAQLQTALATERHASVARSGELEVKLAGERRAHAAEIAEAQSTQAAERTAAVQRIRELEATLEAERDAFVARIRELEAELGSERRAHGDQFAEAQQRYAAERAAAVDRIRELEAQLQRLREALVKLSSSRWLRLGRSLAAIRSRMILRRWA
jgi:glycosyltransferase involved in cell wall biosynthesis